MVKKMEAGQVLGIVFKRQTKGTYADVGAGLASVDSLTAVFDKKGWEGVCVEADTKTRRRGKGNRPGAIWPEGMASGSAHAQVAALAIPAGYPIDEDGKAIYWWEGAVMCSGLTPWPQYRIYAAYIEDGREWGEYDKVYKKRKVRAATCNEILKGCGIEGEVHLLVMDVSGSEPEVMTGFDLGLWHPHIVALRCEDPDRKSSNELYMKAMGYYLLHHDTDGAWLLFSNDNEDRDKLG